jgi:hypothetical protein
MTTATSFVVIPAKAGIQTVSDEDGGVDVAAWIPAFAGMTGDAGAMGDAGVMGRAEP